MSSTFAARSVAGSLNRRQPNHSNSTDNATQTDNINPIESSKTMATQEYLTNCKSLYSCIHCRTHLANHDDLVSRSFQGNQGRAYLFNSVINISCGPAVQRQLNTGSHAVADIFCSNCERMLGWKYEKAYVETQKYKEGKYIIELAHVVRENRHLELDKGEILLSRQLSRSRYSSNSGSKYKQNNSIGKRAAGSSRSSSCSSSSPPLSSPTDSAFADDTYCAMENDCNDDDLDEELMFPFYDDLCANRSSYPGNLSMSHQERARRSLYLGSKPYDWKSRTAESASCSLASPSSAAASSSSPRLTTPATAAAAVAADSALSSDDPPSPSSSHSSCASPSHDTSSSRLHEQLPGAASCKRPKHEPDDRQHRADNESSETQFELDLEQRASGSAFAADRSHDNHGSAGPNSPKQEQAAAIQLDDEEFFDCYTDHDVLN